MLMLIYVNNVNMLLTINDFGPKKILKSIFWVILNRFYSFENKTIQKFHLKTFVIE